ncbi:MAG TPA: hypothetical protein VFI27_07745 [candidate division Zixibacteria bacterium]|nr:hypothetical protein [candidate division Zixibacteria bacterium]
MKDEKKKVRSAVRRQFAENYLLISLVSFGVTVISIRVFLQLTGFPQIGNGVLHIAHTLWGGLLLTVAVMLPLAFANRWAIQASALLSGIGIGLFIDEVGKFITQSNDYFFPPSLALIYGFFLIMVFIYLHFRRPGEEDPRKAMYHVLEELLDAIDGDLDIAEAARIETQLAIARQSDKGEIVTLAEAIIHYLEQEKGSLLVARPGLRRRAAAKVDAIGQKVGRQRHRNIISVVLSLWVIVVIGYIAILVAGVASLDNQIVQWRDLLIAIQVLIGGLLVVAVTTWLTGHEVVGLKFAVLGSLLSLIALQTLYFYLSQFAAITSTLFQLSFLFILLTYRRWYVSDRVFQGE